MIIESIDSSEWLDAEKEWFWLAGATRNRLGNVLKKIFSLVKEITGNDLRSGLRNESKLEGSCPPVPVLVTLCERFNFAEYKQGKLHSKIYGSYDDVLDGLQLEMAEILLENEGYMDRNDFIEECCARGVNFNSIAPTYVTRSIFESFSYGIIALIGANIPTFEVEASRKKYNRKTRVIEDYGWAPDGKIYLLAQLTKSAAVSGILNLPTSIAEFVGTNYSIEFPEAEITFKLDMYKNLINGLRPVFRHCEVQEGDHVLLLFDAQSNQAKLHIGSRDAMEQALNFS